MQVDMIFNGITKTEKTNGLVMVSPNLFHQNFTLNAIFILWHSPTDYEKRKEKKSQTNLLGNPATTTRTTHVNLPSSVDKEVPWRFLVIKFGSLGDPLNRTRQKIPKKEKKKKKKVRKIGDLLSKVVYIIWS